MRVPLFLLLVSLLVGCGGRVHEPAVVNPLAKFAGKWSGPYTLDGSVAGTVTLTVSPSTASDVATEIAGTVASAAQGAGTVRGEIVLDLVSGPSARFNFEFAGDPPPGVIYDLRHQGFASVDARGHLIIVHAPPPNDGSVYMPEDFDLAPVAATP